MIPGIPASTAELVNTRHPSRNLPVPESSVREVREANWSRSDLWLPSPILRRDILTANLKAFADWCTGRGIQHAPHGKTTMSPQLWREQLDHGAWGITAATVAQVRIMVAHGVTRIVLANEVVSQPAIAWLGRILDEHEGLDVVLLVDSVAGVALLDAELRSAGARRPLPVLLEVGVPGGRSGLRDDAAAEEVLAAVASVPTLTLGGVEGFEGIPRGRRGPKTEALVAEHLARVTTLARQAREAGDERFIITTGGSLYPDLAADELAAIASEVDALAILRAGCYITHDDHMYHDSSPLDFQRPGGFLRSALHVEAQVTSVPEPGLALVGAGKRDIGIDAHLPVLLDTAGEHIETLEVSRVDDHHTYVADPGGRLTVGDHVVLGVSHPCTTFDRWPLIPVVDGEAVIDAIATIF